MGDVQRLRLPIQGGRTVAHAPARRASPPMLQTHVPEVIATCPFEPQAVHVTHYEDCEDPVIHALRVWPETRSMIHGLRRKGRWTAAPVCCAGAALASPHVPHPDQVEFDGWDVDVRTLFAAVPAEVREAIRPMPRVYAFRVLCLLAYVPEALDLVREHPVLAGLLAFPERDAQAHSFAELRALLSQPRRRLLPLLGLPAEERIIEALQAMSPDVLRDIGDRALIEDLQPQVD